MGYQALLFCPDEKTARTVTQVLSELDFTVIPCTEPFGAVKKLMGEHFDAVVVDCDNEQNATLLFKSARNTPNNQSSLAVAVVEGQAGVAKAFRIGANLVLTKPINVEQAKGTLRVARGLLRKSEGAKPATSAADTAMKRAAPVPAPPKPAPLATIPSMATARPAAPIASSAAATIPTQKAQPRVVASVPVRTAENSTEPFRATGEEIASPPIAKSVAQTPVPKTTSAVSSPATAESKIEIAANQTSSAGFGTSAASAPAPAREAKPGISSEGTHSTVISEPESPAEKVAAGDSGSSVEETSAASPSFTFGGNVNSGTESAGGGSKKTLLAVAAVLLIAAGGYAAWMQWVRSSGAATPFTHVAATPVTTPAAVSQVAPSAAPAASSSAQPAAASSARSTPDSEAASQPTGTAKISSDSDTQPTAGAENTPVHSSKISAGANSSKTAASGVPTNKVPATDAPAPAIVVKNGASQPAKKAEATPDAPAPSMTEIAPADNGEALTNLMGSQSQAPAPVLQTLNISQGVSRGLLFKKMQPTYPATAMKMRIEGAVELLATITKDGDISAVKVVSGDAQLARAAADAVKQWKYKPYLLNGEPVEIQTPITVNFKLPQ
jgi:TonB family protein